MARTTAPTNEPVETDEPSHLNGIPYFEGEFSVLSPVDSEMDEIMRENLGDEGLRPTDLTRVTFPRDTPAWDVAGKITQTITGVPLKQAVNRAFYLNEYESGSSEQPDCASSDGLNGITKPGFSPFVITPLGMEAEIGGNCARCPLNQWDSAWNKDGNATAGKACREYRQIALLREEDSMPLILRLPPTQLRSWREFCVAVTKARLPISRTVVSLTISKVKDKLNLEAALMAVLRVDVHDRLSGVKGSLSLGAPEQTIALAEYTDDNPPPIDEPF